MEIKGKVVHCETIKKGVSSKTGKAWMSFEFVVETNEQYPKHALLKVFGEDRVKEFGKFCKPGTSVKVQFDVDANEYQGRWYNSLMVWKIEEDVAEETKEDNGGDPFNVDVPSKDKNADGGAKKASGGSGESVGSDDLPF